MDCSAKVLVHAVHTRSVHDNRAVRNHVCGWGGRGQVTDTRHGASDAAAPHHLTHPWQRASHSQTVLLIPLYQTVLLIPLYQAFPFSTYGFGLCFATGIPAPLVLWGSQPKTLVESRLCNETMYAQFGCPSSPTVGVYPLSDGGYAVTNMGQV